MKDEKKCYWFTSLQGTIIGIVKTDSGSLYIGTGNGINEKNDADIIAKYGAKFDLKQINKFFEKK